MSENQSTTNQDWDNWYPDFLKELADHLQQQDPEGFQQMVERVKAWRSESDHRE